MFMSGVVGRGGPIFVMVVKGFQKCNCIAFMYKRLYLIGPHALLLNNCLDALCR